MKVRILTEQESRPANPERTAFTPYMESGSIQDLPDEVAAGMIGRGEAEQVVDQSANDAPPAAA